MYLKPPKFEAFLIIQSSSTINVLFLKVNAFPLLRKRL